LYEYFEPPIGGNVVLHAEAAVGFARCGWFAGAMLCGFREAAQFYVLTQLNDAALSRLSLSMVLRGWPVD
jgi:hypothetical protein